MLKLSFFTQFATNLLQFTTTTTDRKKPPILSTHVYHKQNLKIYLQYGPKSFKKS